MTFLGIPSNSGVKSLPVCYATILAMLTLWQNWLPSKVAENPQSVTYAGIVQSRDHLDASVFVVGLRVASIKHYTAFLRNFDLVYDLEYGLC